MIKKIRTKWKDLMKRYFDEKQKKFWKEEEKKLGKNVMTKICDDRVYCDD